MALVVLLRKPSSQIRFGKSSISQPFSVTNLGNPDHVWSCPIDGASGAFEKAIFPNSFRKIQHQPAIFRNKFGKPWSCLILSRFPKFVTENRSPAYMPTCRHTDNADMPTYRQCRHANMPTCLNWTCLILSGLNMSDPVQISQIRDEGKGRRGAQNVFLWF